MDHPGGLTAALGLWVLAGCAGAPGGVAPPPAPDWPIAGWRRATPESQGIDSDALAGIFDAVREQRAAVHSLLVVRNGRLVLEAYFYPYSGTTVHDVASVTKSITATLTGIAIDRGDLAGVDARVLADLFPAAGRDARKDRVTVEHLLTMTAGLQCRSEDAEATLRDMQQSGDWVRFMLELPMAHEPGTRFVYCSGGTHLLSAIITRATRLSALEFARQVLFEPLGIREAGQHLGGRMPEPIAHPGRNQREARPRSLGSMSYDELVAEHFIIAGTPDEVADKFALVHQNLGVGHLLLEAQESRMDHATTMRSIELMGAKVIPSTAKL